MSVKDEIAAYRKNGVMPAIRDNFLTKLKIDTGFFRICDTFDSIELMFHQTEKNIHLGEAEAIAQAQKRSIQTIFTEDKPCISFIEDKFKHLKQYNTLFLFALLMIHELLSFEEYKTTLAQLKKRNGFNQKMLRMAFENAFLFLGTSKDKKLLKKHTNFKELRIKNYDFFIIRNYFFK